MKKAKFKKHVRKHIRMDPDESKACKKEGGRSKEEVEESISFSFLPMRTPDADDLL